MNQPWLTMRDWPVNAFVFAAAKNSAASATSSVVVHSPSTVSLSITLWDDLVLGDSELFCLFGDLLVHQRRPHEAGADDIRPHPVLGAFLGDDFAEANQAVAWR